MKLLREDVVEDAPALELQDGTCAAADCVDDIECNCSGCCRAFRAYITRHELAQHGYTAGCPSCLNVSIYDSKKWVDHTEACRNRMEALMSDEKKLRVTGRLDEYAAALREAMIAGALVPVGEIVT